MKGGNLRIVGASLALAALAGCSDSMTSGDDAQRVLLEPRSYVQNPATNGTVWACKFTVDPVTGSLIDTYSSGKITAALLSGAGAVTAGPQSISWPTGTQCVKVWQGTEPAEVAVTEVPDAGFALSYYKVATPTDQNPDARIYVNADKSPAPAGATVNLSVDGSGQWEVWFKNVLYTPPPRGCTYTQGYWKTHSDQGPAPYDPRWGAIGADEEATLFFNSGRTWLAVFNTPPQGNAFFQLAHQYMAAKLNVLNGAGTTAAVDAAISGAESLFGGLAAGSTTLTSQQRTQALGWASTLGSYNEGLIGPGHCK